jgi:hypothetical protein
VRREALTWQAAAAAGTPQAIWTYMRRYPRGPHFPDARRRLAGLAAPLDPPPRFDPYDFAGLPAPSEAELETLDRPAMTFDDPAFPPPPPVGDLLPERPVTFEHLLAPVAGAPGRLPTPAPLVLPFSKPVVAAISAPLAQTSAVPVAPPPAAKMIGVPPMPQPPAAMTSPAATSAAAVAPLPPPRPSQAASTSKPEKHKRKPSRVKPAPRHGHGARTAPHAKKKHRRS